MKKREEGVFKNREMSWLECKNSLSFENNVFGWIKRRRLNELNIFQLKGRLNGYTQKY